MRKFLLFLVLIAGGIWVYKNPEQSRLQVGKTSLYLAERLQQLAAYWHPDVAKEVQIRDEERLIELSPDMYVLRVPVFAQTSTGSITLGAGTEMRKVGEGNQKFVLSNNVTQIIVEAEKVTRDPLEVRDLKKKVRHAQDSLRNQNMGNLEAELAKVNLDIATTTRELKDAEDKVADAAERGVGVSMGTATPDFLRNRLIRLERQAKELVSKMERSSPSA